MLENGILKMMIEIEHSRRLFQAYKKVPIAIIREENKLNEELQKLFKKPLKKILDELKRKEVVPSSDMERKILLSELAGITEEFTNTLYESKCEAFYHAYLENAKEIEKAQRKGAKKQKKKLSKAMIAFREANPHIFDRLYKETFEASRMTMDRMIGDINKNLSQSYLDGLGIDKAANNLKDVFQGMQDYELVRIARTEINDAQNEGAYQTELELGIEFDQWWTAEDERVRGTDPNDKANHVEMHGQISKVGASFSNGLIRPGDRDGDISEWIQCRCRLVPFLMPEGFRAPDMDYFYEYDLIKI